MAAELKTAEVQNTAAAVRLLYHFTFSKLQLQKVCGMRIL